MSIKRDDIYSSQFFAGQVVRYHAWPTLRKPNVAEHCWRMAGIYLEMFGLPRAEVLAWIHDHDSGELFAGDVPFGGKNLVSGLRDLIEESEKMGRKKLHLVEYELTEDEKLKCKICDLAEMFEFAYYEIHMGNKLAKPVMEATYRTIVALVPSADTSVSNMMVHRWLDKFLNGVVKWK